MNRFVPLDAISSHIVPCAVFVLGVEWNRVGCRLVEGWDFGCFSPAISYFLFYFVQNFINSNPFFLLPSQRLLSSFELEIYISLSPI